MALDLGVLTRPLFDRHSLSRRVTRSSQQLQGVEWSELDSQADNQKESVGALGKYAPFRNRTFSSAVMPREQGGLGNFPKKRVAFVQLSH